MERPKTSKYSINSHISNYLTGYFEQTKPQFAVLLKGAWGCGKTWYIKNFLEEYQSHPQAKKVVYITLFGLTKLSAIDDAIFYAFHPKLDNPLVKGAQKIFRGLSARYKVDWDDDDENDGSISANLAEIFKSEKSIDFDDFVLILDDLERCEIEENTLFGYVNKFLEHGNHKVVFIGHEDKIKDRESAEVTRYRYKDIKEKLIGQTFEIQGNLENLVDHQMLTCLSHLETDLETKAIRDTIVLVNLDGGNKNLRAIKQNMIAFRWFYRLMPDRLKSNDELLRATVYHYFRLGYELKIGHTTLDDLGKDAFGSFVPPELIEKVNTLVKRNEGDDKRYSESFKYQCPFSNPMWKKYFDKAIVDDAEINAALDSSKYFEFDSKPPWQKLWRASYYNQNKIDEWVLETLVILEGKSLKLYTEIIEIMTSLLDIHTKGIVSTDVLDINKAFEIAKTEVVRISKLVDTAAHLKIWEDMNFRISQDILEDPRLKEMLDDIQRLGSNKQEGSYEDKCKHLLSLLNQNTKSSLDEFENLLRSTNWHTASYAHIPVLSKMDPTILLEALLNVDSQFYWTAQHSLIHRYKRGVDLYKIIDESPFVVEFQECVNAFIKKSPGAINKYKMSSLTSSITEHVLPKLRNVKVP